MTHTLYQSTLRKRGLLADALAALDLLVVLRFSINEARARHVERDLDVAAVLVLDLCVVQPSHLERQLGRIGLARSPLGQPFTCGNGTEHHLALSTFKHPPLELCIAPNETPYASAQTFSLCLVSLGQPLRYICRPKTLRKQFKDLFLFLGRLTDGTFG